MCWVGHVRTMGCFSVFISIKPSLIPPQWFLLGLFLFLFFCFPRSVVSQQASSQLPWVSETSKQGRCFYHMLSGLMLPHACLLLQNSEKERERERLWGADGLGIKEEKKKTPAQLEKPRGVNTQAKRWQLEVEPTERLQSRVGMEHRSATTSVCNSFIQVHSVWLHATVPETGSSYKIGILICKFLHSQ